MTAPLFGPVHSVGGKLICATSNSVLAISPRLKATGNQQFTCPNCGRCGASTVGVPAPKCDHCNFDVTMKPSHNGVIIDDKILAEIARQLNAHKRLLDFAIRVSHFSPFTESAEELRQEAAALFEKPPRDVVNERTEILAFVQRVSLFSAFEEPTEDVVSALRQEAAALFEKLTKGEQS